MSSYILQAINCSTSGNYTDTGAYAANVNQFLIIGNPENHGIPTLPQEKNLDGECVPLPLQTLGFRGFASIDQTI
jgi:hypothetical protein